MTQNRIKKTIDFFELPPKKIAFSILGSFLQALVLLPAVVLVRVAFDVAIPQKNVQLLAAIGLSMFALYIGNALISLWAKRLAINISYAAVKSLRSRFLRHLYSISQAQFESTDKGQIHVHIVKDSERAGNMLRSLLTNFFPSLLVSLLLGTALVLVDGKLFSILILVVPAFALIIRRFGRLVRAKIIQHQSSFEDFSSGTWFVLQMMNLTQTLAGTSREISVQDEKIATLDSDSRILGWYIAIYRTSQELLITSASLIVLIVGGLGVIDGWITIGEVLTFYVVLALLARHLSLLLSAVTDFLDGTEAIRLIESHLNLMPEEVYKGKHPAKFSQGIQLDDVAFSYTGPGGQALIKEASFIVQPSQSLLLLGANGSGKTTLLNLILGFYRPISGKISLDGIPYDEIDMHSLRKLIGVVPQNPILFSGTILENIRYSKPETTIAEVREACQVAKAEEFIEHLVDGLETKIGENAVFLSGGQRQRIAIARALINKPKLLILDEPGNHLETSIVDPIMNNIRKLKYSPALLLVSHNPGIMDYADLVYKIRNRRLMNIDK